MHALVFRRLCSMLSYFCTYTYYFIINILSLCRKLPVAYSRGEGVNVHAFVASSVDQCHAVLAGATKSVTDTLQRIVNATVPHV